MTDNTQTEALLPGRETLMAQAQVFASAWAIAGSRFDSGDGMEVAEQEKAILADMTRRLHARIAELEAQLESIRAGGVNSPLMGQPQAVPDLSALTERRAKAWTAVDAQGLREGFTAADMATASAQGFRDGVDSIAASAPAPSAHIKEPYTLTEIKAKIASNDYSAEMLLQHAMLLLDSASLSANAGEPWTGDPMDWPLPCDLTAGGVTISKGCPLRTVQTRLKVQSEANALLMRGRIAAPPTAQAGGWVSVEDRVPDLMVDVLAGYWYQDTWMQGKPFVFSYGICRMYEMPDDPCFPQGKRWQTHGCAHSQITHWMPLPLPPTSAEGVEHADQA